MPRAPSNPNRRQDLKAALRRAQPDDMLRLEDLARLWGVTKPAFVNELNRLRMSIDFPEPVPGPRNTHQYPARAAVAALVAWESRNDASADAQSKLVGRILGTKKDDPAQTLSPSQILQLNRAAAEVEQREREQGEWIRKTDGSAWAARMFGLVSDRLSNLANRIDPNGRLPSTARTLITEEARKLNLEIYQDMKELFDVDDGRTDSADDRPRRSRARRKSA